MVLTSLEISSSSSALLLEKPKPKPSWVISCSKQEQKQEYKYKVPKLEGFSRSKLERGVKDPPLINKSQSQLSDYCAVLDGEDSYSCWQAYFELQDLQKHYPKEEVEKLIIEAGGVKSLIGCLHGVAAIHKANKAKTDTGVVAGNNNNPTQEAGPIHMHVPDGIPKSAEEIEEEEKAMMPDSPYTRLLRLRGIHPAWYSPAPDHQTD